ncbi:MAG: hypothetical protein QUS14_07715 [Pyrinomonadaceae bacterium]|nr:hypothetical protein [Pyrinomonadaceae bacterium]
MKKLFVLAIASSMLTGLASPAFADVTVKQRVTMGGQQMESTRQIKGSRERSETKIEMEGVNPDFMPQIATITQCDLRRNVKLNDRKRLYFVEPFAVADTPAPARPTAPSTRTNTATRKGGTLTMTYSIRDTGERKTMFGMTARHLIVTQEMESSADSCNGPSKTKMVFDGWYVDFSADFNCPIDLPQPTYEGMGSKSDCIDKIITKQSGAGKLGFLLDGTMTIYDADGKATMSQRTETLELSRAPIAANVFEIPAGYKEAGSMQDLYAMPSVQDMMRDQADNDGNTPTQPGRPTTPSSMAKTVAVNLSFGSGVKGNQAEIDQYVRSRIASRGLRAVSGSGDFSLTIQVRQAKESTAGKIGGIFGKVTGVPAGGGQVDIDLSASLSGGGAGETRVKKKFDGPLSAALKAAIDEALDTVLADLE